MDVLQVVLDDFGYASVHPWVDVPPGVTYGKALEFTYAVILHACMGISPLTGISMFLLFYSSISISTLGGISNNFGSIHERQMN